MKCSRCGAHSTTKTCGQCSASYFNWKSQKAEQSYNKLIAKINVSKLKNNPVNINLDFCSHNSTNILNKELYCALCGEILF